jgi:hypothetical protein
MGYRKQSDSTWKLREDVKTNADEALNTVVCYDSEDRDPDLSSLSELHREIINLKLQGLNQEQIGKVLSKSKAWVCIELKKIKTILKEN